MFIHHDFSLITSHYIAWLYTVPWVPVIGVSLCVPCIVWGITTIRVPTIISWVATHSLTLVALVLATVSCYQGTTLVIDLQKNTFKCWRYKFEILILTWPKLLYIKNTMSVCLSPWDRQFYSPWGKHFQYTGEGGKHFQTQRGGQTFSGWDVTGDDDVDGEEEADVREANIVARKASKTSTGARILRGQ